MTGYEKDRKWSDKYIPLMSQIIGPHLLRPAPFEMDAKQATDLVILKARDMTIACRVRRPGYLEKYGWQFTMRSKRTNGTETEASKITNGWGDWMFYAHAAEGDVLAFSRWMLLDLAAWRAHMLRDGWRKIPQIKWGQDLPNGDRETCFNWFDVRSFVGAPTLVIAASEAIPEMHYEQAA